MAGILDLTRDHAEALVGTKKPTADALVTLEQLNAVTNMHAHLHALIHELQCPSAIVCIQQLKEEVGGVLCSHTRMVPCRA